MVTPDTLDVDSFSQRKTHIDRCIEIGELNATTPLVVPNLEVGELPLVGSFKGQRRVLVRISESAYNIDKLLRTHGVLKYIDENGNMHVVNSVVDYLEVL